jgi:hypothetical protein
MLPYESVQQMPGSMSRVHCPDPNAFERAQYMRAVTRVQHVLARGNVSSTGEILYFNFAATSSAGRFFQYCVRLSSEVKVRLCIRST